MYKTYGSAEFEFPDDGSRIKISGVGSPFTDKSELSDHDIDNLREDLKLWSYQNKIRTISNIMKSNTHKVFTMYAEKSINNGWGSYIEKMIYKHANGKYYAMHVGPPLDPEVFNNTFYGININKLTKIPTRNLYTQLTRNQPTIPATKYCKRNVNSNQIKLCVIAFTYNNSKYCGFAANLGDGELYTYNTKMRQWEYLFTDRPELTLDRISVYPLKQVLTQKMFENV